MTTSVENVWTDFGDTLKRFILARVSDEQVAEDILQNVFLKIHANIADLNEDDRLQAWIYQIARNEVVDHYRRSRAGEELPDDLATPADERNEAEHQLARSLRAMIE